jgi:hypothetical protein
MFAEPLLPSARKLRLSNAGGLTQALWSLPSRDYPAVAVKRLIQGRGKVKTWIGDIFQAMSTLDAGMQARKHPQDLDWSLVSSIRDTYSDIEDLDCLDCCGSCEARRLARVHCRLLLPSIGLQHMRLLDCSISGV